MGQFSCVSGSGFPVRRIGPRQRLFRIMKTYRNGSSAAAWYFSSSDGGQPGRYDLPRPNGSCYFADDPAGAWLEVFRGQQVVPRQDIAVRSMVTAARTGDVLALADLTSPSAVKSGVTLDLSAGSHYKPSQFAALAAYQQKCLGIIGWIRHDPARRYRNFALFGRSGGHRSQRGWTTTIADLDGSAAAIARRLGVRVASIPFDMPTTTPPTPGRR